MGEDQTDPWAEGAETIPSLAAHPPPIPKSPRPWMVGGGIAAAIGLVVAIVIVTGGSDGDGEQPTSPTTTVGSTSGTGTTVAGSALATTTTTLIPDAVTPPEALPPGEDSPLAVFDGLQPIAVKIDNSESSRPQIGLSGAAMILEMPVEGGLTRFTAIFLGNRPAAVGPVRSMRPVDADLLAAFQPVLVSTGGRPFVRREVVAAGIVEITTDSDPDLFRVLERPAPNNIVASIPRIGEIANGGAPQTAPFPFGGDGIGGEEARSVRIPFSSINDVTWTWDSGRYMRTLNRQPSEVLPAIGADPEPLTADTILVLQVAQRSAGYTDVAGADVPTFDVIGFGKFFVFNGGRVLEGEWRRSSQQEGYRLIGLDGANIRLPGGRLFVEIVPRSVPIEVR